MWRAYSEAFPFPEERHDIRAAMIAQTFRNVVDSALRGKDAKFTTLHDHLVRYVGFDGLQEAKAEPMTDEDAREKEVGRLLSVTKMLHVAMGGKL